MTSLGLACVASTPARAQNAPIAPPEQASEAAPSSGQVEVQNPAPTEAQNPAPVEAQNPAPTEAQNPSQDVAPPEQQQAAAPAEKHYGLVKLFKDALSGLQLRTDQTEAIKKLCDQVEAVQGPAEQAKKDLLGALGKQIASGAVDATALDPEIAGVSKAAEHASPVIRSSLDKLHGILDKDQRVEFVQGFEKALTTRIARHADKRWEDEVGLSAEQKSRIEAITSRHTKRIDQALGRMLRVLAAFEGDTFAIDEVLPERDAGEHAAKMAKGMIQVASEVTAVLTPEQRQKIADKLGGERAKGEEEQQPQGAPEQQQQGAPEQQQPQQPNVNVGRTASPLWGYGGGYMGRGFGFGGVGYHTGFASGYGFSRSYVGGMGYVF
jgi:hypothetical protein